VSFVREGTAVTSARTIETFEEYSSLKLSEQELMMMLKVMSR
jgi:hypothetical protein